VSPAAERRGGGRAAPFVIALEFDGVARAFTTPGGGVHCVLDGVSFPVATGSFIAIVGPSGCGKSTLLNIAAGLLPPSSGTIRVNSAPLTGINGSATYMFQQDALLPWKTVRDNVALGLTLAGTARADAHTRADAWLQRVGLAAFAAHYPSKLSGGMRKRAAMAQHWIIDRPILLMDEPFSALDVHTRLKMESELLHFWDAPLAAARKTIVFVTHDLEEAIALADDVVVLSAGPAARVVARHAVTLARPRDLMELRTTPEFVAHYRELWSVLRQEVVRSQEASRG
jgi:NitT/TauT family transport system ATP-binding protein